MKHFKSHSVQHGQTFIEIVLAVYMIGSLLSALLLLQSSVFSHVATSVARMNRIILLENYLFDIDLDARIEKKTESKRTVQNSSTKLSYTASAAKTESDIQRFKNIEIIRLNAVWDQSHTQAQESLIAFRYRPKKEAV